MRLVGHLRWVLCALAVVAPASVAAEAARDCLEVHLRIEGGTSAQAETVCGAIEAAGDTLRDCGLTQKAPVLIRIVPGSVSAEIPCLGRFDSAAGTISLTDPRTYCEFLAPDSVYAGLPADEVFGSLAVHEYTHALLDQAVPDPRIPWVDQEYVAYAMQLQTMAEAPRNAIVATYRTGTRIEDGTINGIIHQLAPLLFASRAWTHFSQEENGCGFVRKLIAGQASFALPDPGFWP